MTDLGDFYGRVREGELNDLDSFEAVDNMFPEVKEEETAPPPSANEPQEEEEGHGFLDYLEWAAGPLLAIGDAVLAPVGKAETVAEAFEISGQAFLRRFFPELGDDVPDYGMQVVEAYMEDIPDGVKPVVANTLNMVSDPSIMLGLPTLKMLQKGTTAAVKAGVAEEGVWSLGLKDLMGVFDIQHQAVRQKGAITAFKPSGKVSKETKQLQDLARRADEGDLAALKELDRKLNIEKARAAATFLDNDTILRHMQQVDTILGSPNESMIRNVAKHAPENVTESFQRHTLSQSTDINITRINSVEDVDKYLESLSKSYDSLAFEGYQKSGVRPDGPGKPLTDEEMLSQQIKLLNDFLGRPGDPSAMSRWISEGSNGWEAYVSRQALADSAGRISKLAQEVADPNLRNATKRYALTKSIYIHKIMMERALGLTPSASRDALHSLRIISSSPTARFQELERLYPLTRGTRVLDRAFYELAAHGDPKTVNALVDGMFRARPMDVIYEIFINNILSGPITHGINVTSNAFSLAMRPTMKYIESLSASARLDFERARVDFAEANAMMVGIMESVGDLTKIVAKFGDPDGVIPGELARLHELYRLRHIPKITSEALNVQGPLGWLVDYTGKIVRLPGDALLKEDVAFKLINYRMEVNARAARTAMKQGTNPADTLARYHLLKEHPSDVVTSQGIDVANYYTFTNSLGQKGKQLQGFARLGPMRWILPFVQTPTNLVKFGVRHSVFGNIYKDFKHITRLDATGDLARAQIAIGTMIPAALLMHFDENVTGAINTQTPAGRLAQTQGKPEYSIKIGDKWYSYGTIEPLRTVLGLLASYKTAVQHLDLEDKEHKEISKDLLAAAAAPFIKVATQNYLLPQLEGVFYMFQGLAKGDHAYALKFMQRLAASSTPAVGSQFISQINKTFNDPVWRQADNYIQMIMDKIPGLSTRLPAWHNIWGDEVGIPEGLGPDIVTPVRFREEPRDAVDKEMIRLFVDRPRRNDDTASLPHQRRVIDGIELTPQQRANFNIFVGKGLPGTAMVPLKNQIAREMSSPTFQNLPDVMKRRNIVSTINARRNQVERWMKGNDPDLKQKLEKARRLREIRERPTR